MIEHILLGLAVLVIIGLGYAIYILCSAMPNIKF